MSILESLPCPQSPWLAWIGIPLQLFQAIFLHPYFQIHHPKATRLYRLMVIPICIYMAFATVPRRTIWPIEKFVHFNFGFVTMPTFHFICLSIIFGFHQGPVFKSEVELFNQEDPKPNPDPAGRDEKLPPAEDQHVPQDDTKSSNYLRNRKSKSKRRAAQPANTSVEETQKVPALESSTVTTHSAKTWVEGPPSIGELARWISALIMK